MNEVVYVYLFFQYQSPCLWTQVTPTVVGKVNILNASDNKKVGFL